MWYNLLLDKVLHNTFFMRTSLRFYIGFLAIALLTLPTFTSAGVNDNTRVWGWIGGNTLDDANPEDINDPKADRLGWLSTNCYTSYNGGFENRCDAPTYYDYGVSIDVKTGIVTGEGWIGIADDNDPANHAIGWLSFDYDMVCYGQPPTCEPPALPRPIEVQGKKYVARVVEQGNTFIFEGWGRILSLKQEGERLGFNDWGWVKLSHSDGAGPDAEYALEFVPQTRVVRGLSFSGGGTVTGGGYDMGTGLGYIAGSIGPVNFPYFETTLGDIYGRTKIGSAKTIGPPTELSRYTATYLALSSGTIKAVGVSPDGAIIENLDYSIALPQDVNRFTNVLGKIPIYGNAPQLATEIGNEGKNVFGEKITLSNKTKSSQVWNNGKPRLNGSVTVIAGNFEIDQLLEFQNGNVPEPRGDGVVYVKGDLNIKSTMSYQSLSGIGGNMERIASVVWIVEGDVKVPYTLGDDNPNNTDIVGAFFVLGRAPDADGIGTFTVESLPLNLYAAGDRDKPFVMEGLVVAEKFDLQRTYIDEVVVQNPAEKFINDGRFLINPPRSMRSVSDALPVFSTSIPE